MLYLKFTSVLFSQALCLGNATVTVDFTHWSEFSTLSSHMYEQVLCCSEVLLKDIELNRLFLYWKLVSSNCLYLSPNFIHYIWNLFISSFGAKDNSSVQVIMEVLVWISDVFFIQSFVTMIQWTSIIRKTNYFFILL